MTALKTPAPDAPPEEWGAFATSIPNWRWPWTCTNTEVCPPMPGHVWLEGAWCYTDTASKTAQYSRIRAIPDPDHWAWEGWLLRLLESADPRPYRRPGGLWVVATGPGVAFEPDRLQPRTLGRAAIAAAAALGRWPGGAS